MSKNASWFFLVSRVYTNVVEVKRLIVTRTDVNPHDDSERSGIHIGAVNDVPVEIIGHITQAKIPCDVVVRYSVGIPVRFPGTGVDFYCGKEPVVPLMMNMFFLFSTL